MRILALDIATSTGWAFYDTDRHASAIECGAIDLSVGKDTLKAFEKRRLMRVLIDEKVCGLIDRYRPDLACLEQPLNYIKQGGGKRPKKAPLFKGDPLPDPTPKEGDGKGGPNADTVLMLNQIFAVASTVCRHKCEMTIEVDPKTWQTLTSRFPGDTKARSVAFCEMLKVLIPGDLNKVRRGDAADAAVIAFWAAGHSQQVKLLERAA